MSRSMTSGTVGDMWIYSDSVLTACMFLLCLLASCSVALVFLWLVEAVCFRLPLWIVSKLTPPGSSEGNASGRLSSRPGGRSCNLGDPCDSLCKAKLTRDRSGGSLAVDEQTPFPSTYGDRGLNI